MLTLTSDYVVELILPPPSNSLSAPSVSVTKVQNEGLLERDRFDPSEYGHLWSGPG